MDPKDIPATPTTYPLNQALFRMMATPTERIKASRSSSETQCTICSTIRHRLLTCQRCQSMWYCSKECQKKDWPNHKALCTSADRPKGIRKLVETFVCNPALNGILQVCAALDLDLANDEKKEIGFKVPFMIRADIAIEPSDVHSLVKLFLTDEPLPGKTEGMVQLNHFEAHIPGRSGHAPLTSACDLLWRNARERLNKDPTRCTDPLGLIEFGYDSEFSITASLSVSPTMLRMARNRVPFVEDSGPTAGAFQEPMTLHTCMEFINVHIRSDQQNQLRLRAEMTEKDRGIIRAARDKSPVRRAPFLLRQKLAREAIYANVPLD